MVLTKYAKIFLFFILMLFVMLLEFLFVDVFKVGITFGTHVEYWIVIDTYMLISYKKFWFVTWNEILIKNDINCTIFCTL